MSASPTAKGRVYFLQMGTGGPVKIGWSQNEHGVERRLAGCQTGNPEQLQIVAHHAGTPTDEWRLHQRFRSFRLYGEWFLPSPNVLKAAADGPSSWPTNYAVQGIHVDDDEALFWRNWMAGRQKVYEDYADELVAETGDR